MRFLPVFPSGIILEKKERKTPDSRLACTYLNEGGGLKSSGVLYQNKKKKTKAFGRATGHRPPLTSWKKRKAERAVAGPFPREKRKRCERPRRRKAEGRGKGRPPKKGGKAKSIKTLATGIVEKKGHLSYKRPSYSCVKAEELPLKGKSKEEIRGWSLA